MQCLHHSLLFEGLQQQYPSQGPPPGPQPVSSYESAAQPLGYQPPPAVCSYEPTRPPPGPPPVSSYAPAPPVFQQQSSNTVRISLFAETMHACGSFYLYTVLVLIVILLQYAYMCDNLSKNNRDNDYHVCKVSWY